MKRYRDLGKAIGLLPAGAKNALTDVPGVSVGHETIMHQIGHEDYVCTGVTAILPHQGNLFQKKVIAASYVFNGFGKSAGLMQLDELGRLESPVMLTNTLAVPAVTQGTLAYLLEENQSIGEGTGTVNVVVGECNDSYLNSIRHFSIEPAHARKAIRNARTDQVAEGAVGAGAGMVCFDYKGGIGTSSRLVSTGEHTHYTVGCLVLSNFGRKEELAHYEPFLAGLAKTEPDQSIDADGSIMMVLATDAPVNERQLKRIAKRCGIGLGRTGSHMAHGSGDVVIAFSTAQTFPHETAMTTEYVKQIREDQPIMNELFAAASEATHEAILNSLTMAKTTKGRKGRVIQGILA